jgi:hypothetical protein
MHKISTPSASSIKIVPSLVSGLLAVVFAAGDERSLPAAPMLLVAVGVMGIIGIAMTMSRRDCADEVFDCGDHLLVKKSGEEDMLPLSNITNVNFSKNSENISARITLRLATPGKFGTEITFPPPSQIYFGCRPKNEIAEDRRVRADRARRGQGSMFLE